MTALLQRELTLVVADDGLPIACAPGHDEDAAAWAWRRAHDAHLTRDARDAWIAARRADGWSIARVFVGTGASIVETKELGGAS